MTTRRTFIKLLSAIPPVLTVSRSWAANPSPDPSRLALVIGNSSYRDAPLLNPSNDAKAISRLFSEAGFAVDSRLNASRIDMMSAIERFGTAVKRSETKLVVFYYAGHGAQLDWRNYLLPVDAVVERQEHMRERCVDLSLLLGQFSAAKDKTFVVILDACRNNPFGTSYRPEQKGLSQFDAPVGSLLAYATSPGNVASDGVGEHGLYTEHLVRELSKRNTRIEDALKRVRLNVRLASKGDQIPWETTSLEGDVFIFSEGQKKLSEAELEQQVEADMTEWTRIKSSKKTDDWVTYLRTFPNGRFAEIAQMRLSRLLADVEKQRLELFQEETAQAEKLAAEKRRHQEQERIRVAEAQRLADERKRIEPQALAAVKSPSTEKVVANPAPSQLYKPVTTVPSGMPKIEIRAGVTVPVFIVPSANPFSAGRYPLGRIYTVGDEFVSRRTDILTGLEEGVFTLHVTQVDIDADRVEFNDGNFISDLMGNIIKNGPVVFDTPVQYTPAEFQIGKKWTAAFRRTQNGRTTNAYYNMHIVKRETISVPAGSFDTFKIEGDGWNTSNGSRLEVRFWLVPGLNFPIRREFVTRNSRGGFFDTERRELVSMRQYASGLAI